MRKVKKIVNFINSLELKRKDSVVFPNASADFYLKFINSSYMVVGELRIHGKYLYDVYNAKKSYEINNIESVWEQLKTLCEGTRINKKDGVFDTEQFKSEMKDRGYKFEIKDVAQDFLPAVRKRMIIGSEAIDIYRYDNNESMEEDAGRIDSGGCTYSGINSKKVSWTKAPHFYKKGNIIVLYVGNDRDIISHLSEILGNQFAGQ